MQEYIDKIYYGNLQLAMEEDPDGNQTSWHQHAVEWTQEDLANKVGNYLNKKYWRKQDDINKNFFD